MRKQSVPVSQPLLDGNEKRYLIECVETGWISSEGAFVRRFEDQLAQRVGRRYGIAVCNGSAALEVAVAATGIGEGDEVILPDFTIISCPTAIVRAGGVPVVVDSEPYTWTMDVAKIEEKITPKTKAIMVVHIYGLPVDMDPVLELGKRYGLAIIEDAAQMHGQTYKGRPCGSFGSISTFSFYPNKHITTGEGGMVLVDSESMAEKCRSLRNLCFEANQRFIHEKLGWNFRMSNLQAAVGLAQLERLDEFVRRKRRMGMRYTKLLMDIDGVELPVASTDYADNIYWVYGVVLKEKVAFDAREAMRRLADHRIGSRPFFWPVHEQPVFKRMGFFHKESCPVAERLARRGFYIPSGMALSEDEIEYTAEILHRIMA